MNSPPYYDYHPGYELILNPTMHHLHNYNMHDMWVCLHKPFPVVSLSYSHRIPLLCIVVMGVWVLIVINLILLVYENDIIIVLIQGSLVHRGITDVTDLETWSAIGKTEVLDNRKTNAFLVKVAMSSPIYMIASNWVL